MTPLKKKDVITFGRYKGTSIENMLSGSITASRGLSKKLIKASSRNYLRWCSREGILTFSESVLKNLQKDWYTPKIEHVVNNSVNSNSFTNF